MYNVLGSFLLKMWLCISLIIICIIDKKIRIKYIIDNDCKINYCCLLLVEKKYI